MTVIPLPRPDTGVPLVVAVDQFLERFRDTPGTAATYAETLTRLRAAAGDQLPVAALTPLLYAQTMARWDTRGRHDIQQAPGRAELVRRLLPPPGLAGH